jgi:hypothetical protein
MASTNQNMKKMTTPIEEPVIAELTKLSIPADAVLILIEERRRQEADGGYYVLPRSRKVDGVEYTIGTDPQGLIRLTIRTETPEVILLPRKLKDVKLTVEY